MIRPLATSETRRSFSLPKFGAVCATVLLLTAGLHGQLLGSGGNLQGRVEDPSGAALVGASVELRNSVAAYDRWASSGQNGEFHFDNIPFNTYELIVHAPGFLRPVEVERHRLEPHRTLHLRRHRAARVLDRSAWVGRARLLVPWESVRAASSATTPRSSGASAQDLSCT